MVLEAEAHLALHVVHHRAVTRYAICAVGVVLFLGRSFCGGWLGALGHILGGGTAASLGFIVKRGIILFSVSKKAIGKVETLHSHWHV